MKKQITVFGVCASIATFAGIAAAGWVHSSTITGVGCWEDGNCYLTYPNNMPPQAPQCDVPTQAFFSLSTAAGQEMYRSALSAFISGRNVRTVLEGCMTVRGKSAAKAIRLGVE